MGEYSRHHLYTVDLNKPLKRHYMGLLLAEGDVQGDTFTFKVERDGEAFNATGIPYMKGYLTRSDGVTVCFDEEYLADDGTVSLTLDKKCYACTGRFTLSVQMTDYPETETTIIIIDGYMCHVKADSYVYPDGSTGTGSGSNSGSVGGVAVPDYVVTEAMAVLDKVVNAQGSRTFTLGAISDMHYGSSDYIDGVIHAAQGLKHISDRIKLDAVAVLGDYTDEHQMDTDTAITDLEEMNALLDPLRHNVNLRLKGNHDHRPDKDAQIYRYITAYSDDVVWGSRIGGYFYRDFADYKLRIICVNTTEVARSNLSVSDAQYQWFCGALDLSAKADASEWGILLLSHHPLDFTVTDGLYRFGSILRAYKNGLSWSDGTISCNYTGGKNAAAIICNIHGHLHNLLSAEMYLDAPGSSEQIGIWRMCTPAARVDYVNHYSAPWVESQWWEKTKNTADDTSFCVYCIDLDAKTVKAICYGAGYDRTLTYEGNGSSSGGESGGGSDTPTTVDNWLPISTDANGNVYNGTGYKANTRYSASSNAESDYTGIYLSGYIPVEQGDVVTLENVGLATTGDSARVNVVIFGTEKASAWEAANVETLISRFSAVLDSDGVTVKQFSIPDAGTKYIRFNASYLGADSVVKIS